MRRSRRDSRQVVVVPDLKRVVVLFNLFLVGWVVAGDVSDVLSLRSPGKLLNSVGCIGDFLRVAAAHRHDKHLRAIFLFCGVLTCGVVFRVGGVIFPVFGVGHDRKECQFAAARGPTRRPYPLAVEGQHSLGTGRHFDQHQFVVGTILVEILPRYHADD